MSACRKAYLVTENDENQGGIVFAATNIEARRLGANEWNDGQLGGMTVTRAKWADQYAGSGVPASEMIKRGWRWDGCSYCGQELSQDALDDRGLTAADVIGTDGSAIYCCCACSDYAVAEKIKRKKLAGIAIAELQEVIKRRFPEADLSVGRNHAYHERPYRGPTRVALWLTSEVSVDFGFPGAVYGPATLHLRRGYLDCQRIGPPSLYFTCCGGDRETFEAWANGGKLMEAPHA